MDSEAVLSARTAIADTMNFLVLVMVISRFMQREDRPAVIEIWTGAMPCDVIAVTRAAVARRLHRHDDHSSVSMTAETNRAGVSRRIA